MVDRSSGLLYEDGQGYSKLDAQSARDRLDGYAVVSGLGVTVDSGLTLSVASGEATVGQTSGSVDTVSNGGTTVTLNSADSTLPRKDTVYIDTAGNIQATAGTPQAAEPSGNTRDNTYVPEPPFPGTEGTILAEVWVGAGVTTLQSADVRDRRVPADVVGDRGVFGEVQSELVSTEKSFNNNALDNAVLSTDYNYTADDWETVPYDSVDANFDSSTGVYTAPDNGIYHIVASVRFLANENDSLRVAVNVANDRRETIGHNSAGGVDDVAIGYTTDDISAGTQIKIQARNFNSDVTISSGTTNSRAKIYRMG